MPADVKVVLVAERIEIQGFDHDGGTQLLRRRKQPHQQRRLEELCTRQGGVQVGPREERGLPLLISRCRVHPAGEDTREGAGPCIVLPAARRRADGPSCLLAAGQATWCFLPSYARCVTPNLLKSSLAVI